MTRTVIVTIGDIEVVQLGPIGERAPFGYRYHAVRNGEVLASFNTVADAAAYVGCMTYALQVPR